MAPITEGERYIFSDIEQAIKNALAQMPYLGEMLNNDSIVDDPIASNQVSHQETPYNLSGDNTEKRSVLVDTAEKVSPKIIEISETEQVYNEFPFRYTDPSQESIKLPFLENPVKSTIEEMQRVLNSRGDSFPDKTEPSPEEMLNLISQDLGICPSNNASPRGGDTFARSRNEGFEVKPPSKDKKQKKLKQEKVKREKKTQERKGKSNKANNPEGNRMKELMNIYGRPGEHIKKRHSDSTLGSKSEVSRQPSMKTLKNDLSKASSIAISKKSKRKKQKISKKIDVDLYNDYSAQEKSSKISSKRKNRNSNQYLLKKHSFKKTNFMKESSDIEDLGRNIVSKDKIPSKTGKNKMRSSENGNWHRMELKEYPIRKNERNSLLCNRKGNNNYHNESPLNSNKHVMHNRGHGIKSDASKNTSQFQSMDTNNDLMNETFSLNNSDHALITMKRRLSDETKLNKQVLFSDDTLQNAKNFKPDITESKNTQDSFDRANIDFGRQTMQYHYTLPTKSSRSKEVERFLNGHYQYLPFVIGQSTNKSHNLLVNIQEALSLIKQKLPQTSEVIAPGPEANSEYPTNERPLSVISKFTSRSVKKQNECCAHRSEGLYDIPEMDDDLAGKSWEDNPECMQANIDPNRVRPRCSCTSQASMSYKRVLQQIFGGDSVDFSMASESNRGAAFEDQLQEQGDNYRNILRNLLQDLAQEFDELNRKYEEMVMDPNTSKEEVNNLEALLESKEEEIRSIIARFNEVNEGSTRAYVEGNRSRASFGNIKPYKSTTSIRLAQTLRRVQQFKDAICSRPSVPYLSKSNYMQSS